ncbi:MAG: RidA family protein [Bacillota bacterium]|nr:RidA family protein [Bacillota bacterium]
MKLVQIQDTRPPAGHFSPVVVSEAGIVYVSGQVPVDYRTNKIVTGDLETQFKQVLKNLKAALNSAGADIEDILKVTILVADGNDWYQINQLYKKFMGHHKPARTIIPVLPLHNGYKVEVEAIAELKTEKKEK